MKYSDKDIESVRQLDIIDFLSRYEGFSFHRAGRGYKCDEHNSLYIYPDRRGWHWNSQDKCGSSVIDYCQKMKGMSFPDTIKMFLGENTIEIPKASITVEKTVEKPFALPEKSQDSANGTNAIPATPGKARITLTHPGGKHPYHLLHLTPSTSNVYGWVDAGSFTKI